MNGDPRWNFYGSPPPHWAYPPPAHPNEDPMSVYMKYDAFMSAKQKEWEEIERKKKEKDKDKDKPKHRALTVFEMFLIMTILSLPMGYFVSSSMKFFLLGIQSNLGALVK